MEEIKVVSINESQTQPIVEATTKEGFGVTEPIDPSELRDIPLTKIQDFDAIEREFLNTTSTETTGSIAGMNLAVGDVVCFIDESLTDNWTRASVAQNFWDLTTQNHIVLVYDCGTGVKIDSIAVRLKKDGTSTSTIDAQIVSGFTTVSGTQYNETGITTHETSSNSHTLASLSWVYTEKSFTFAGTVYTGVVGIKIRWNGTISAVNHPVIYKDASQGNHPRAEAHTIDTSTNPDERNQIDDIRWSITGDYDGIYTVHGDFPERSVIIGEVLEIATQWSTVRLNTSEILYKQSGLTPGDAYKVWYNWLDTTSSFLAWFAMTASLLRINQLDFPLVKFDIITFSRNITDASADVAYSHSLGKKPQLIYFYSHSVTNADKRSTGGYITATDSNKCIWYAPYSSDYNINEGYCIIYETTGNEAQLAKIKEVTTTDFTIFWTEYLTPSSEDTVTIAFLVW